MVYMASENLIDQLRLDFSDGNSLSASRVTFGGLLQDRLLDTLALGKRNQCLRGLSVRLADYENVSKSSSERISNGILDVNDIERSRVSLSVNDDTYSTQVTTSSDHNYVSNVELDKVGDLSSLDIELDAIIDSNKGIGVSNGSSVVKNNIRNSLGSNSQLLNLAELVLGLIGRDGLKNESSLGVVQESEILTSLLDGDDILKTRGISSIGSDLAVDLDESLLDDLSDLVSGKSVFQSVSQQNNDGKALS